MKGSFHSIYLHQHTANKVSPVFPTWGVVPNIFQRVTQYDCKSPSLKIYKLHLLVRYFCGEKKNNTLTTASSISVRKSKSWNGLCPSVTNSKRSIPYENISTWWKIREKTIQNEIKKDWPWKKIFSIGDIKIIQQPFSVTWQFSPWEPVSYLKYDHGKTVHSFYLVWHSLFCLWWLGSCSVMYQEGLSNWDTWICRLINCFTSH